ncbi:hypothetical protein [Psychromonas antarctica]|jgi:hypothetical protein|uniref:hypothetical protein n=1 Tax=Psychromonas antarctica TaxID=67573 RepID=UPI001EE7D6D9|nr:hypothetical protein [Psychromonas antarctica]MCG6201473.1 hypothetical protein [Psychromonas antarctica]
MRLSSKGWNNVLIFGILTIIFVFHFSQKLTLSAKIEQRSVISNEFIIVEIKTPDFEIKRVGRSWKSEPDLGLSKNQLALLVQNWQQLKLETQSTVTTKQPPYLIYIYSANQAQPTIVQLFQQGDNYSLQLDSTISLFLSAEQLPLLLGR